MFETIGRAMIAVVAGVLLQTSSCTSGVGVDVDVNDDGVNVDVDVDGGIGNGDVSGDNILVRFSNQTPHALDVEFHVSPTVASDVADALFVEANRVVEGLGFAGTGLIPSRSSDEVVLACDDAAVLGTLGGSFVDPDGGELIGVGEQRVAVSGLQFECKDRITFFFDDDGDEFTTAMVIE